MDTKALEQEYLSKIGRYHDRYPLAGGQYYGSNFNPELQLRLNIALREGYKGNQETREWFVDFIKERHPDQLDTFIARYDASAKSLRKVDTLKGIATHSDVVCADLFVLDEDAILTVIPSTAYNGDMLDELIHSETEATDFFNLEPRTYWLDQSKVDYLR